MMTLSDLRGLPHFSISQLKTFLQCPRKYRFQYVDRVEPEFRPIALAFGTAWHETIDAHLLPPLKDQFLPRQELQAAAFGDSLTEQVNEDGPPVLFEDEEDLGSTIDLGLKMLDAFILRVPRPEQVLGVEVPFVLELVHPMTGEIAPLPLIGGIDAIVVDEGATFVWELKTGKKKWSADQLEYDPQPTAYTIAARELGYEEAGVKLLVTTKTREPDVQIEEGRSRAWRRARARGDRAQCPARSKGWRRRAHPRMGMPVVRVRRRVCSVRRCHPHFSNGVVLPCHTGPRRGGDRAKARGHGDSASQRDASEPTWLARRARRSGNPPGVVFPSWIPGEVSRPASNRDHDVGSPRYALVLAQRRAGGLPMGERNCFPWRSVLGHPAWFAGVGEASWAGPGRCVVGYDHRAAGESLMELKEARATGALALYDAEVRPALGGAEAQPVSDLDTAAQLLRVALAMQHVLRVGFLGESQVGKSSIINALVGQRVLPSGGVGPLTASATTIAYSARPLVRVRYHARKRINEFRFALQGYLQSLGELSPTGGDPPPETPEAGSDDATPTSFATMDFSKANEGTDDGPTDERRRMGEYLVKQARLMLGAPDTMPRTNVFHLVRALAAKDETSVAVPADPDLRERVAHIRRLLDRSEEFTRETPEPRKFGDEVRARAAGWMSPLIAELHVSLDLPLLSLAQIIDLPGVGVVGDPAGRVAEEFVRKEADALVIVMRNNGVTEQVAGLLERTGVISRLLWSNQSAAPPIHVAIAVTRLDDVAKDEWRKRVVEARENGASTPRRDEVFRELSDQMATVVRRQVADALMSSHEFDDLSPELRAQREHVVRMLSEAMEVVCVSAPDYLGILEGFEDDCFLRDKDETNIPHLVGQITNLAGRATKARAERLADAFAGFGDGVVRSLRLQEHALRDRKAARTAADARFRSALAVAAEPLKAEAVRHRREFMDFLKTSMPERFDTLSESAADRARKRLKKQKGDGARLRWATLNAALVRTGAFNGAVHIDYPGDLTRAFVDVIAGSWEKDVVAEVRVAFRRLCEADAELVQSLSESAAGILDTDELRVTSRDLQQQIRDQGKVAISWTQAQLEELSEDVRKKLADVVGRPIERSCLNARKAGDNHGTGARDSILEVFDIGGKEAIEKARAACVEILGEHVEKLRRSLGGVRPARELRSRYVHLRHHRRCAGRGRREAGGHAATRATRRTQGASRTVRGADRTGRWHG